MQIPTLVFEKLKQHVTKFIELEESEFRGMLPAFQVMDVNKKVNLLGAGQLCRYNYFVVQGCLRKFFINEKGTEVTTDFAIENWWITDNMAYEHQQPAEFSIQAVEPSQVIFIDHATQEKLLRQQPKMERYFRFIYQRAYAAAERRIKYMYDYSKEDYYYFFQSRYPEFVQRVPQYLLASFLGLTPEYLSEIRRHKRS